MTHKIEQLKCPDCGMTWHQSILAEEEVVECPHCKKIVKTLTALDLARKDIW